jgi:hypothetical protein
MPKDSTGAVLAQVGQALGVFAQFLGASSPPAAEAAEASGAGEADEAGEAQTVSMTLQDMMLQLRRPPPSPFTIDHSTPLKGLEGLLTRAPPDVKEFILYMQDGLRQETMLEQLDRFVGTLAAKSSAAASRIGATCALVRALHQPHELKEIEEGEYEDPLYAFTKTSSSSRIQVMKLFEDGRTAVIEAGTWVEASAFSRTLRKVRKAMIKAAVSVELKQQIAEHLPASTKIDEHDGYDIFKAVGVFRTAKDAAVAYLDSLALFETAPAAPAAAAAAAPAPPPAAEPTEAAPYVMQNHTLVAHARKEAESCRSQGISKFSTIHIDSQTAGLTTEALRPLALDRKAFR